MELRLIIPLITICVAIVNIARQKRLTIVHLVQSRIEVLQTTTFVKHIRSTDSCESIAK
jgi:hypothetical protein